jgi:hypothetical protein
MIAKSARVKRLPPSEAKKYMAKAQQYGRVMQHALAEGEWDAAGLNAIHCAVSAGDAVCISRAGTHSASTSHEEAAKLLNDCIRGSATEAAARHLIWLVNKKNLVEYEGRMLTESEAKTAVKHAERFLAWALKTISPEHMPPEPKT